VSSSTGDQPRSEPRSRRVVVLISLAVVAVLVLLTAYILFMYNAMHRPKPAGPVVLVEARYAGASAETMDRVVTDPLCVSLYGTQDVEEMLGVSTSDGKGQIYLYLKPKTQVAIIQTLIQNRVAMIAPTLPNGVVPTVRILDEASPLWLVLGGTLKADQLADVAEKEVFPEAAKLEGVSQARFAGLSPGESLRAPTLDVLIDSEKAAEHGIAVGNVSQAIRQQLERKPPLTALELREQTIKASDGTQVPLGKLARIEEVLGFSAISRWGGRQVIAIGLVPVAGVTTAELNQRLAPLIPPLRAKLPNGAELTLLAP
jgi:multidrug efflux pump subunit AcrB